MKIAANQEALLLGVIFTFWTLKLYYKLYDKKIRKYILMIGFLMIFWMIVRITKSIITDNYFDRMFWYLYYVALIGIPCVFYQCCLELGHKLTKGKKIVTTVGAVLLLLLVITNDFHQLVFRFLDGFSNYDNYKHSYGYYVICIWIFYLFGAGIVRLVKNRWEIKKDFKAFLPIVLVLIGLLYTILYVLGVPVIKSTSMTTVLAILIYLGIEVILYLELIPNNSRYIKYFEESSLEMMIISLDGKTVYKTKAFDKVPEFIRKDIDKRKVKNKYKEGNTIYDVKVNKDSYVVFKKDIRKLNELKREVKEKQEELLIQQNSIKNEEKIRKELAEVKLRKDIILKLEGNVEEKIKEAKEILKRDNVLDEDLERIKLIIAYSKRKSFLIIAELNNDIYKEEGIKLIIRELLSDVKAVGIKGEVVVGKISINSYMMSNIYEVIFNVLYNIKDTDVMIFITKKQDVVEVKCVIGGAFSIKDKLKLGRSILVEEELYDNDTNLTFKIKEEIR